MAPRAIENGCRKSCALPGFDSWTVQSIESCSTDYAILAHNIVWEVLFAFDISFIQLIRNLGVCWEFILIIVHSVLSTSSTDLIDHLRYVIFGHHVNLHWSSQAEELDTSIKLGPQRYKTACGRLKLEVGAGSRVCCSSHILGTSVKCMHSYIVYIFWKCITYILPHFLSCVRVLCVKSHWLKSRKHAVHKPSLVFGSQNTSLRACVDGLSVPQFG